MMKKILAAGMTWLWLATAAAGDTIVDGNGRVLEGIQVVIEDPGTVAYRGEGQEVRMPEWRVALVLYEEAPVAWKEMADCWRRKEWPGVEARASGLCGEKQVLRLEAAARFAWAEAARALARSGVAAEQYRKVVEQFPDSRFLRGSLLALREISIAAGDADGGIAWSRRYLAGATQWGWPREELGNVRAGLAGLLEKRGDAAGALALLEEAFARFPEGFPREIWQWDVLAGLVRLRQQRGDPAGVNVLLERFRKLAALPAERQRLALLEGQALLAAGKISEGIFTLTSLRVSGSGEEEGRRARALLLEAFQALLPRFPAARRYLERYQEESRRLPSGGEGSGKGGGKEPG